MRTTRISRIVSATSTLSLSLSLATAGCTEGGVGGSDPLIAAQQALPEGAPSPTGASGLQAMPSVQTVAFDFDTGNGAIEVIIPSVVPVIFANVTPGDATIVLRFTTLITNSWFDAVAPYHPTAIGIYSDLGRRPPGEAATNANPNIAIFYASYRVLNSLAPQNKAGWDAMMTSVGLDPNDDHESTTDAIGIGNAAGNAVVANRENDGFNQLGFDDGRAYNPEPYSDYTGYKPKNTAYRLEDDRRWQPRIVVNPYGLSRVQQFVTPQYALTTPYSFDDPQDFGVPKPKKSYRQGPGGNQAYRAQADEVLAASANLTDEQKLHAELFNDKIRSLGFAAVFVAVSRGMSLIDFVHYDFLTNLAAFDTGIVVWQEKTKWDAVRPFSAIRRLYGDDEVTAWGGPGMGTVDDITGDEWKEYLAVADHPEYPSGSASFCAAHAQASRLYLGSDDFGWVVPVAAGSSLVEPGITPAVDINLEYETFTDFMTTCGYSRLWGGVHFEDAILAGFDLGTEVGTGAYEFVQAHIDGDVP
jgi:hypothetical protein